MKKLPLLLLATLFLTGCTPEKIEDKIQGNWSTCSYRGDYIELYIQDDQYSEVTDFDLTLPWKKFAIEGDSLYQETEFTRGEMLVIGSKIELPDPNTFVLYFKGEKPWTFHRIEESITISENDAINIANTKKRAEKCNCPDQRTEEEIHQDSNKVYFQF
jgi:hypothetical protein